MRFSKIVMLALAASAVGPAYAQSDADRYNEAQRALNRQEFDEAITALRALRRDYPESRYVDDSYYWEAFALERTGNPERALEVIDTLLSEHADAESIDDAQALRIQICSELARRGDGDCAAQISSTVRDLDQLREPPTSDDAYSHGQDAQTPANVSRFPQSDLHTSPPHGR